MFAVNPGMLAAGASGDGYAAFVAHITTLATGGERAWTGQALSGSYTTTAGPPSGSMFGSSWSSYFFSAAAIARFIQHGLPSEAAFNDQASASRKIFLTTTYIGELTSFTGQNRNGYTSLSDVREDGGDALQCTRILYWFGGSAWEMNPSIGAGPTPYTGHLS